jgi:hypothetical protein
MSERSSSIEEALSKLVKLEEEHAKLLEVSTRLREQIELMRQGSPNAEGTRATPKDSM